MKSEKGENIPSLLLDIEAGERFDYIAEIGKSMFAESGLVDASKDVTTDDVALIEIFHKRVSPLHPDRPWRVTAEPRSFEQGQIVDPSYFSNWESPEGAHEHMLLATKTAPLALELIKSNIKVPQNDGDTRLMQLIERIVRINEHHLAAGAGFHDEGRNVSQVFFTNEVIGRRLLQQMNIRQDIIDILPDEYVMLLPPDEDMGGYFMRMDPEAVLIRIADEFGKRIPGTNRVRRADDFSEEAQKAWSERYLKSQFSGRPSDKFGRLSMKLHNSNAERYNKAVDTWIQTVSTMNLQTLTSEISRRLSPELVHV